MEAAIHQDYVEITVDMDDSFGPAMWEVWGLVSKACKLMPVMVKLS